MLDHLNPYLEPMPIRNTGYSTIPAAILTILLLTFSGCNQETTSAEEANNYPERGNWCGYSEKSPTKESAFECGTSDQPVPTVESTAIMRKEDPWPQTIVLKDWRKGEAVEVARITLQAYKMMEPTSPGIPVTTYHDGDPTPMHFDHRDDHGYIKLKVTKIDWSPCEDYDGSPSYKIIQRILWTKVNPAPWNRPNLKEPSTKVRKRYITAPNFEYVKGDSLPPPTIFKVDRNGRHTLTIGFLAVTPHSTQDRASTYDFDFEISGLGPALEEFSTAQQNRNE
jgi:hypothetical protein